jgi:predicted hydrocarbon binding protein/predicted regulator of Ras-like GTPase activity (Roadblock/LC7/MglB family)
MEAILKEISAIVGVSGCFVCNSEGDVLASTLPSVLDQDALVTVGRTISQTTAGIFAARRRKVHELDLLFSEGRMVVKPLSQGSLCVLCARNMNVPLLNLTANVAARKLSEEMKGNRLESGAVEPDAVLAEQALQGIVDAYPDIVSPVMGLEQSLTAANRDSVLTMLGRRAGAEVFQRRYASMSVPASVSQALELVVVPAVSPFAIADARGGTLDVLACPFCRNAPSSTPRCHFLAGFVQGLLNSVPGLAQVEVAETLCRGKGDDTCSFWATQKGT